MYICWNGMGYMFMIINDKDFKRFGFIVYWCRKCGVEGFWFFWSMMNELVLFWRMNVFWFLWVDDCIEFGWMKFYWCFWSVVWILICYVVCFCCVLFFCVYCYFVFVVFIFIFVVVICIFDVLKVFDWFVFVIFCICGGLDFVWELD